jgi:DNA-binding transcriptional ArsR family regulator
MLAGRDKFQSLSKISRSHLLTLAPSTPFDPSASMEHVEFFRGLADPVRLEMIRAMAREREVACTTYERRFALAKSTISYHIRTLRMAGMITVRKEGPYYYYQLQESTFERLAPGMLKSFRKVDGAASKERSK